MHKSGDVGIVFDSSGTIVQRSGNGTIENRVQAKGGARRLERNAKKIVEKQN